tara:strand:- start:1959 stop:2639 length:681 start_codon:yes stop_codon:yes gene_type:complete
MITSKQEKNLFDNGYIEIPQLAYDGPIEEFKNISKDLDKTYNSNTDFHNRYLEKHKIKTKFRDKVFDLAKNYLKISVDKDDIYTISRIVYSFDNLESYRGHFDSHLFTLVTPVIIPKANDPESGQLIVFPKIRNEPKSELSNFYGKLKFNLLYSNKKGFEKLMSKYTYKEFDFSNLNPVLFLGRQCFHGNRSFAKAPDGIRVTLLTHFFDPNSNGIGSVLRKLRNR